jgi:Uma2 family endonuclease
MPAAVKKLSWADFLRFPDDGNRHEVIEGEEFMTPPPTPSHQRTVVNLVRRVADHAEAHRAGVVYASPIGVFLGRHHAVQPDVLFVAKERLSIVKEDGIHGAPDLVIEVLSPSTADHDRREKLDLYRRAGVREYWLVDPASKTVEIREFGSPRRTRVYKAGQSFTSTLLPGLTIRVAGLF